ncbi:MULTISPECIES: hypothetical protein [Emticicia]|uniref:hypothetical protein n=1 Tax=Emticicia TaxID=312278 RepID=UPI0007D8A96C|nr:MULTISPECIES: hypothetical protein [Emticicia]
MKKILLSFVFIAFAISCFAQSFSVDNKGLSVPKFADQTAINAAISTPTTGTLVYNNALNQYAYYNGSAWTNFPAAPNSGSQWQTTNYYTPNDIQFNAGNVIIGSVATNRFLQIQNQSNLATSLELLALSTTNQMRFTSINPSASFNQKFVGGSTAATSTLSWNHVDLNNNQAETPLMSVQGNGNFTVNGFSKFGGSTSAFPAMKTMMLTGTTAASGLTTTVVHGLTASKIIGFQVIVAGGVSSDIYVPSNHPDPGMTFFSAYDAGSFYITRSSSNGSQLISKPYKILITYTN